VQVKGVPEKGSRITPTTPLRGPSKPGECQLAKRSGPRAGGAARTPGVASPTPRIRHRELLGMAGLGPERLDFRAPRPQVCWRIAGEEVRTLPL